MEDVKMWLACAVVVQFGLFLLTFLVGSLFLHPFHLQTAFGGGRVFVWDGVMLMLLLYGLVVGLEAGMKRLRALAGWTTLALAMAAGTGLAMKFGFLVVDR